MATFRYDRGVLTEEWSSSSGVGGIPGWLCRGLCLDTLFAYSHLTEFQLTRYRFEEVPYRRELDVISLDGTAVTLFTIDVRLGPITATNTAPHRFVTYCVKLGPVAFANYAPMQDTGVYSGLSVMQYELAFQPLRYT